MDERQKNEFVKKEDLPVFGIQDTKELLIFGLDLQEAITVSLEDKKVTLLDAPNFLKPLRSAVPAFGGLQNVKNELLDLDQNEKAQLEAIVKERFDLKDDHLEEIVERAITWALETYLLATDIGQYRKDKTA